MYQYLQGSLCPCMVEEITINKFASSFFWNSWFCNS
jgi:hypothetical protein